MQNEMRETRTLRTVPALLVQLDADGSTPLFRQLFDALRTAIQRGELKAGTRLPSTRALAADLCISRNTVALAYDHLYAAGYVATRRGAGTYVTRSGSAAGTNGNAHHVAGNHADARVSPLGETLLREDPAAVLRPGPARPFRPGETDIEDFPADRWLRLLRRGGPPRTRDLLAGGDHLGDPALRHAILEHLALTRGVRADVSQLMLVRGTQQVMDLGMRLLLEPGDTVWLEDPGYHITRTILGANGFELAHVPLDEEGLDVRAGVAAAPDARAVVVTPSAQFPLGVTMSVARRAALLEWAHAADAWILEDDYECEFHIGARPVPSIQHFDRHGRVIHFGTFSRTMFPALRLGYMVLPAALVPVFERARERFDMLPPTDEQAALAAFIADGHFARHVRRLRERNRRRRAALQQAVSRIPGLRCAPQDCGSNALLWLPAGTDENALERAALERGVEVRPLSWYGVRAQLPPGVVLGLSGYSEDAVRAALTLLGDALRATTPRGR